MAARRNSRQKPRYLTDQRSGLTPVNRVSQALLGAEAAAKRPVRTARDRALRRAGRSCLVLNQGQGKPDRQGVEGVLPRYRAAPEVTPARASPAEVRALGDGHGS